MTMTTADYALIVSLFSTVVALASLGWNIWSKFIYPKARVQVSFNVVSIVGGGQDPADVPRYLCVYGLNHGPTDVTIKNMSVIFRKRWWQRGQFALINPIHNILGDPAVGIGPFGGGLPKKLQVGEGHSLYFPFSVDSFARDRLSRVGLNDSFGRFHGCAIKEIRAVKAELAKAFLAQH